MISPRLMQTYLLDGTLEGIRIIELSESSIKAFVIPRLRVNSANDRPELKQPALYFLINSGDNQVYIGESENFFHRIKNHDQSKDFWDIAIALVSNTNALEKGDVKYLESLVVEKAKATAAVEVLNRTVPLRNNVHEFKLHSLQAILRDTALIAESLGYSIFETKQDASVGIWFCKTKKTDAKAQFRGDKFIVLAGSIIDKTYAPSWAKDWPKSYAERLEIFTKHGKDKGSVIELTENVPFRSPNHAGGFLTGRSINAWFGFKSADGKTMDEIMRKGDQ